MPNTVWSYSVKGMRPGVLLGDDRILLHYIPEGRTGDSTILRCFTFGGRELWNHSGWRGLISLPGNRFLVASSGVPLLITDGGQVLRRWTADGVEQVTRHNNLLLLADKRHVWAADLELSHLWELTWPGESSPAIDCFVNGRLYWTEGNTLRSCIPEGGSAVLGQLSESAMREAMHRHERTTGGSALSGWYASLGTGSEFVPFQAGDRPQHYYWRVSFDARMNCFLLANALAPHLVLCLDDKGQHLWCQYLSCGCCGGVPVALPDGHYVASSGCGGILSWLSSDGAILFQTVPHEGVGLATAYSSDICVLPNGRVLIEGGPGVVMYSPTGVLLWKWDRSFSHFCYDNDNDILVGCYWRNKGDGIASETCLEFATGL